MKYKVKSPKIRFIGFTDDWEQRKLGEVGSVSMCRRIFKEQTSESGDIPFYKIGTFGGQADAYISEELFEEYKLKYPYPKVGDILISASGSIGRTVEFTGENAYFQDSNIVWLNHDEQIDNTFLKSFYNVVKWSGLEGSTIKRLYNDNILKTEISIPSIDEQHKIGEYFENLDHLITLHQRKCDNLVNIKKSMLEKMFPKNGCGVPEVRFKGFTDAWEQRKLGDLVIDHNAGIYISKEDYGSGTNVIGVGNIYDNDIFDGEIYRLGPVNDDRFLLEENDLIYGESSLVPEGIARTVCVGKNGVGSAFAWHTRRVKLDQNLVNSHFATLELNYNIAIRKYLMSVSTQTALTGMTTEGYFGATLVLPSVKEQAVISEFFKNLDYLITLHQRKLEKLKNMKKSMLEKMFV